ncbi:MAG: SDR family NAD(P)-dependent oxidoreductase, partial [Actinobacteria bacterium]|nr:SDR family NAD(P)-dependent oxidoreductase [Actinomycetota bacterium]
MALRQPHPSSSLFRAGCSDRTSVPAEVKIAGKVVVVTGAGSGIGRACAVAMAAAGAATVVLADIDATAAAAAAELLRSRGTD